MATVTRHNVEKLTANQLTALKAAYRRFQEITDNRGYKFIAGHHGVPGNYCEHGTNLFLPWHRAYMYDFEQALRDIDPELGIPYWDWTSTDSHTNGVPAAFRNAMDPNNTPNPLFRFPVKHPRNQDGTIRNSLAPAVLAGRYRATTARVTELLDIDDYLDFNRDLEQAPHNAVHLWTGGDGGDMTDPNWAGYDPIFYSHHCMIDRIWHLWQQKWGYDRIPKRLLNLPLQPFNVKVADVLDIAQLGYNYA